MRSHYYNTFWDIKNPYLFSLFFAFAQKNHSLCVLEIVLMLDRYVYMNISVSVF
jgi:hypothetical protein